jgi:hypothetical protein
MSIASPAHRDGDRVPSFDAGAVHGLWAEVAAPISRAGLGIRSLRNRHEGDEELVRALDELIGELDRAFGAVLRGPAANHLDGADPSPRMRG